MFSLWTYPIIHAELSVIEGEITMQARLEAQKVSPAAYQAMLGLRSLLNNPSWSQLCLNW